jgi:hypothetical protein
MHADRLIHSGDLIERRMIEMSNTACPNHESRPTFRAFCADCLGSPVPETKKAACSACGAVTWITVQEQTDPSSVAGYSQLDGQCIDCWSASIEALAKEYQSKLSELSRLQAVIHSRRAKLATIQEVAYRGFVPAVPCACGQIFPSFIEAGLHVDTASPKGGHWLLDVDRAAPAKPSPRAPREFDFENVG